VSSTWSAPVSDHHWAITSDELVLVMSDGTRETWTRAPAE
jgi:hypothetical protein